MTKIQFAKLLVSLSVSVFSVSAIAHGKHVHGEGNMDVVIDKNMVTIALEIPMESLVGFERAPKTSQEKASLDAALKNLKDVHTVWGLPDAAKCQPVSTEVTLPTFSNAHADMQANYAFRCDAPEKLTSLDAILFKSFKRLQRLDVQRIGPTGQSGGQLTPSRSKLSW